MADRYGKAAAAESLRVAVQQFEERERQRAIEAARVSAMMRDAMDSLDGDDFPATRSALSTARDNLIGVQGVSDVRYALTKVLTIW